MRIARIGSLFAFTTVCLWGQGVVHAQDLVQTLLPAPGSLHASYGYTLAVDGSTLVAGDYQYRPNDPETNCTGSGWGAVDIYKKPTGGSWTLSQTFQYTPGTAESMFGHYVSIKGNVFVTTAEREPFVSGGTTISRAGAFFVYRRASSTANFALLAKVYAPVPTLNHDFTFLGAGPVTNGTYIAVAASPWASPVQTYVYQITATSVVQVATITTPNTATRMFITDQNVLVILTNGQAATPLAYRLNGSQVTQIDTSSLSHTFYVTQAALAGDGNTVAFLKRVSFGPGSNGAFGLQIVKFTATGIEWSDFRPLPMNYDGLDDALSIPSAPPSLMTLEENQGLFVAFPTANPATTFVLGYKYAGTRYNEAGVVRTGVNHTFAVSDHFAESVAFNGTDLFIGDPWFVTTPGGPNYCTNPGTVGDIRVLQPLAAPNAPGPESSTKLQPWLTSTVTDIGTAVATDGTYVLAGSIWDQDAWGTTGEITLFQNVSGTWRHVERYVDGWSGWEGFDGWSGFGTSVDLNDNFIVIGAPKAASFESQVRSGAVYIARKVNGVFENGPELTNEGALPGIPAGTYFGNAVALAGTTLAGTTLAIGAPDWENPPSRGSVWIYNYGGSGSDWISNQVLGPNTASGQDWEAFGYSVDASGDNLIVGIPFRSSNGRDYAGAIQIFRKDASGFYNSVFEANAPTALPAFSYIGATVTIGTDWAAAGGGTGSVVIYRRSTSTGIWSQNTVITPSPAMNGFGYSVAIEGTRLVVGSPYENKVFRYERNFQGAWPRTGTITGPTTTGSFGLSVALRNGSVAIGDYEALSGTSNFNTGAVYIVGFTDL